MNVTEALHARISVRAFTDQPVSEEAVRAILDAARWSPSGGNLQPWKVIVVAGEERQKVIDLANDSTGRDFGAEIGGIPIYPPDLPEPYRTRRLEVGEAMYEKLGIGRDDKPARIARMAQNFQFFGAPVGLFFVIDRCMGYGQWAHLGMFMQSIALVAVERGLATCMQEAWATVRKTLHAHFGLAENDLLYCGMALGHADATHPVNTLRSTRASVDEFATLRGFESA